MKIEVIKIEELKPLEKNVRKHNEKQIAELTRSLNQFGQTRAIIVDENNNILIGNGLYMAMKSRGDKTAECSRVKGLSERQKKKLVLSDNKVFALGSDDYDMIQEFINDITSEGDFDIAGFDDDTLKAMSREMEEVARDVASYGIVPEGAIKPQNSPSTPESTNNGQTDGASANQPEASNYKEAEELFQPPHVAEVKNDRTIICPNCGEVIHLD